MNPFRISREKGFTILEVVFAVSILAIGIMGYTILKTSSRHSRVYSKSLSQAVSLTTSQLEFLLSRGYKDALLSGDLTPTGIIHVHSIENGWALESGDFVATDGTWSVKNECPTELAKLVNYNTLWSNKSMDITQVQVR